MEALSEELGVQFNLKSSTYKSQRCSCCGWVRKSNRKGKNFTCSCCGLMIDSDLNAAENNEIELPEIPYSFRNKKLNIVGFYLLESGIFTSKGESLQSSLPQNV